MVVSGEFTAVHKTVAYMRTKLHRRGVDSSHRAGRREGREEQGGEWGEGKGAWRRVGERGVWRRRGGGCDHCLTE